MNSSNLTTDNFEDTLRLAKEGQAEALDLLFGALYGRVETLVHGSLARDMGSKRPWLSARFSTGDVVQEVFRSVLKDLGNFNGTTESSFIAYLTQVVRNRIIDIIRFHESDRRDGRRAQLDVECDELPHLTNGPATLSSIADGRRVYEHVITSFSTLEQRLLRGRLEQELEFKELSRELGYNSVSTVRRAFYCANSLFVIRLRQFYLEVGE
ncbi:MAG: sigma-70 family RNA polymerase sigma factor [bacterium]|nr:sigma-70 family RNA polymerase sigma factor [bacterium]